MRATDIHSDRERNPSSGSKVGVHIHIYILIEFQTRKQGPDWKRDIEYTSLMSFLSLLFTLYINFLVRSAGFISGKEEMRFRYRALWTFEEIAKEDIDSGKLFNLLLLIE